MQWRLCEETERDRSGRRHTWSARLTSGGSPHEESFGGLHARWLEHIEAPGRNPKTVVENRRMAAAFPEELCSKDLQ